MKAIFKELEGSLTIVTGGARGIGKVFASAFMAQGAEVVILDNDQETGKKTRAELSQRGNISFEKCDVSDYEQVKQTIDKIAEKEGKIDILINNAGITKDGLFIRMKPEQWQKVIDINLTGIFNCSHAVTKYMRKVRKGYIVNIASISAEGNPGQANYAASKGGVISLTKSLGKELAPMGIRVNAIAPGYVNTDMTSVLSEKIRERTISLIPMGRFGEPEEIASVALFLCSGLASFVTGKTLFVDGGML